MGCEEEFQHNESFEILEEAIGFVTEKKGGRGPETASLESSYLKGKE